MDLTRLGGLANGEARATQWHFEGKLTSSCNSPVRDPLRSTATLLVAASSLASEMYSCVAL